MVRRRRASELHAWVFHPKVGPTGFDPWHATDLPMIPGGAKSFTQGQHANLGTVPQH
jgi:hypothetical protein